MKTDEVIVKKSSINGKGVFAARDFKKGEVILHWDTSKKLSQKEIDSLSPKEKAYVCLIEDTYVQMQEPECYVNHSCDANTTTKEFCDVANRDIKKDEEITGNYNEVASGGPTIECNCGCSNCCGRINS